MTESLINIAAIWSDIFMIHVLEVSLFIGLVWLTDIFLKLPVRYRYTLWLLVLLKLFFPPVLKVPGAVEQAIPSAIPLLQGVAVSPVSGPVQSELPGEVLALLIWGTGTVLLLALISVKTIRLWLHLRDAKPIELPAQFETETDISFWESDGISSPILFGLFRPRLYLPTCWSSFEERHLKSIIVHEATHHQSRDTLVLFAQYIGLILFWFNPLVWLAHFRLNQIREMRCDEIAVERTGLSPTEYSRLLIRIVEQYQKSWGALVLSRSFSEHKKSLFGRINHILNPREVDMKKRWMYYAAPVVMALLILPLSWQCSASKSPLAPDIAQDTSQKSNVPEGTEFVRYDSAPSPIGGFKAIQEALQYPTEAKDKGISGRAILQVLVSETGEVGEVKVMKSAGDRSLDLAAVAAVKKVPWEPAKQRDRNVTVWVAIPVVFGDPEPMPLPSPNSLEQSSMSTVSPPAYDSPPKPVGGFGGLQSALRYPEIARRAGIQGKVILEIFVSEEGDVTETRVIKSMGNNGLDEAAIYAAKAVKWKPAVLNDQPVATWVSLPIVFRLPEADKISWGSEVRPFDTPPMPVGGLEAIAANLKYEATGWKAGADLKLLMNVRVSASGEVLDVQLKDSLHEKVDADLVEAAKTALQEVRWNPAEKDGEPVETWVTVPVNFKIEVEKK